MTSRADNLPNESVNQQRSAFSRRVSNWSLDDVVKYLFVLLYLQGVPIHRRYIAALLQLCGQHPRHSNSRRSGAIEVDDDDDDEEDLGRIGRESISSTSTEAAMQQQRVEKVMDALYTRCQNSLRALEAAGLTSAPPRAVLLDHASAFPAASPRLHNVPAALVSSTRADVIAIVPLSTTTTQSTSVVEVSVAGGQRSSSCSSANSSLAAAYYLRALDDAVQFESKHLKSNDGTSSSLPTKNMPSRRRQLVPGGRTGGKPAIHSVQGKRPRSDAKSSVVVIQDDDDDDIGDDSHSYSNAPCAVNVDAIDEPQQQQQSSESPVQNNGSSSSTNSRSSQQRQATLSFFSCASQTPKVAPLNSTRGTSSPPAQTLESNASATTLASPAGAAVVDVIEIG